MRILHWAEFYPPYRGGIEVVASNLVAGLAARGHEIAVATNAGTDLPARERAGNIEIFRFAFQDAIASNSVADIARVVAAVNRMKRNFKPDIVHLHFLGTSSFFHTQTLNAHRAPMVVTIHGWFGECEGGTGTLLHRILSTADCVTAVSNAMLEEARSLVPAIVGRSCVIYNALRGALYRDLGPRDSGALFSFGRHVREKGLDLAIDALALVRRRHPLAHLTIASDGPERPALERQVHDMQLGDAVTFKGWLDDDALQAEIAKARIVIVPSRWREGFGLAALEAALQARPVVATNIGGLPEVVLDGCTGILVAPESASAITEAVISLLDHPDEAERLGRQARVAAETRFAFDAHLDHYESLYHRVRERQCSEAIGA